MAKYLKIFWLIWVYRFEDKEMKIRNGFVSNSSSSSFMIRLDDITSKQLRQIQHHGPCNQGDEWSIRIRDHIVVGMTWMDNFDMHYYLDKIGVDMNLVHWDEYDNWEDEE